MNEKPILFSGPMVRAILDGRKTQTRRAVKPPKLHPDTGLPDWNRAWEDLSGKKENPKDVYCLKVPFGSGSEETSHRIYPRWESGNRLWVRETFCNPGNDFDSCQYRADEYDESVTWKPSIFMPRKFSRITLEIIGVRVERLQQISRKDAMAEGIYLNENDYWTAGEMEPGKVLAGLDCPQHAYGRLWEYINGAGSWLLNPWVWVIEFRKV